METIVRERLRFIATLVQRAGPYLLLELLLPGGTLFALLLFLYRRRQRERSPQLATRGEGTPELASAVWALLSLPGVAAPAHRGQIRDGLEPLAMAPGC
jgi:hypothetical protein